MRNTVVVIVGIAMLAATGGVVGLVADTPLVVPFLVACGVVSVVLVRRSLEEDRARAEYRRYVEGLGRVCEGSELPEEDDRDWV